jgi:hypothetical protein
MTANDSALFQRLRDRQKENARLYARRYLPAWLSPVVSFLGLHFAALSLVLTLVLALFGWASLGDRIVAWQKAVLWL